jgi:xanthine/uracil/vitamin C permease (AzgA family)
MQIYIFAPLLIIPFTFNVTLGIAISLITLALSTLANFATVLAYHFPPSDYTFGYKDPDMTVSFDEYTRLVYNAAWIRSQVYIIGFLLGYFLHRNPKIKINRVGQFSFDL